MIAQYAVDGMTKPMGISQYELSKMLTKQLKGLESPQTDLEEKSIEEDLDGGQQGAHREEVESPCPFLRIGRRRESRPLTARFVPRVIVSSTTPDGDEGEAQLLKLNEALRQKVERLFQEVTDLRRENEALKEKNSDYLATIFRLQSISDSGSDTSPEIQPIMAPTI